MSINPQDVARLQPTSTSLNIILKNTHFKDDILAEKAQIQFRIDYSMPVPILIFRFSEPFYDFGEVLKLETLIAAYGEWLDKSNIIVKLVMSDTVVTDKISSREFVLSESESNILKAEMNKQRSMNVEEIQNIETSIYNDFKI